jgi:phosphatidylinositol-3,4,5-trisphosphate 3-phosphatase/dual-specificity protein phosphatase PTEN
MNMHLIIADLQNVAVLHCLAGKGRIGTAICCFLLYSGRFDSAEDAMNFYARKRYLPLLDFTDCVLS